jgi:hypothetical protein
MDKVNIFYGQLEHFTAFYSHLENIAVVWYIFSFFGILYQETSGSPDSEVYNLNFHILSLDILGFDNVEPSVMRSTWVCILQLKLSVAKSSSVHFRHSIFF